MASEQRIINPSLSGNCTTSQIEAKKGLIDGAVEISPFDPTANNLLSKIPNLNASTWELYFFDAVSSSSSSSLSNSAVTLSFFHEGRGGLKMQLLVMWPNGETSVTEFLAEESTISDCEANGVRGVWRRTETEGGGSASFEISSDLNQAIVNLDLPPTAADAATAVHGSITFSSMSPQRSTDTDTCPEEKEDTLHLLAPAVTWLQPIPRASVEMDLNIKGKDLSFTGLGGLDRFWSPHTWMTLMDESIYLRAHAGPYTLIMLRIMSRIDRGVPHASVYLFQDNKRVFATQDERISLSSEFYSFKRTYHGAVKGDFLDSATGTVIDMVIPKKGKHWRFETEHGSVWWNMPTGPSGTGNSGFVDKVIGGEVGGEVFEGEGTAGVCQLPPIPPKELT
ncbi:MAG: hypothetical protein Q9225_000812 [Loekoesia sp. 1 TL-2023]